MVEIWIDGDRVEAEDGQTVMQAARASGHEIPYFCWHPALSVPGNCRICMVEVEGDGASAGWLDIACNMPIAEGMRVRTDSERVRARRKEMLQLITLNHPVDCGICDKAGECTLQKQYFDWDAKYARNDGIKVHKAKHVDIGKHIVLDQERCILCTRCIRVCAEVAQQPELTMAQRGDHEVLTTAPGKRLDNPYSLNTVDVCPVGALTSKDFRFTMRAWELQATPSVCPGCATGCNVEVHTSREQIYRLVPRENPYVNQYWMCDEGRFTYKRIYDDRLGQPMSGGELVEWDRALEDAARLLRAAVDQGAGKVGVVFSAQSTNEDLYALSRLAFDSLGVTRAYVAGLDQGWSDNILVSADKNPNTAGAIAIGGGRLKSLMDLANDVKSGAITTLLVVGERGVLGDGGTSALPISKLQALIVLGWRKGPLVNAAHVALPLADWAEIDGTFTNRQGTVQRIRAAVPPAGDALPGWEIVTLLAHRLGMPLEFGGRPSTSPPSARAVFLEAREKMAFMKNADWGRTSLPIQLRFANSRG